MAKARLELEVAVKAAVVKPGDTLVLLASAPMTDKQVADLISQIGERLPGVKVAVIDCIDQALVYKPDPNTCICTRVPNGIDLDPACPSHGIGATL